MDAVTEAVAFMENDFAFNSGRSSALNVEGFVRMDAIIMDGSSPSLGTVASVTRVRNPIKLARAVMERAGHSMFVGEWADSLAKKLDLEVVNPSYFITER